MVSTFSRDWIVLADAGGEAPPLMAFAVAAKAVRDTIVSRWSGPIPELISGHQADSSPSREPHMAVVPLADVGRASSRGRVLGAAIVLPSPESGVWSEAEIAAAREVLLGRISENALVLTLGALGVWEIEYQPDPRAAALTPSQYVGPSRQWASVTPVVLDKHPHDPGQLRSIIEEACVAIGLPRPRVYPDRQSSIAGSPASQTGDSAWGEGGWQLARRKDGAPHWLANRLTRHVRLEFAAPVTGPIILGAGRHLGLGLCRPLAID